MTSDTDELLALRDALRACPKYQSEEFTDRRVTRARPASPNASRTELPLKGLALPDGNARNIAGPKACPSPRLRPSRQGAREFIRRALEWGEYANLR